MQSQITTSHVQEKGEGRSFLVSVLAHGLLVALIALAGHFFPVGQILDIGSGPGGGEGRTFIKVGITSELQGGGLGTVKPMLTPRPTAAPPPPKKIEKEPDPPQPDPRTFVEKKPPPKKTAADRPPTPPPPQKPVETRPGDIVQNPDPGAGDRGRASPGVGGGLGSGVGIELGSGRNVPGRIDSYYVRLVEQRVGENWLQTSLGELSRPVQTIVTFEVRRDGVISNIRIVKPSGIRSVDVAAERAVVASHPLPPMPVEFRGRTVRFRAEFNYPPK